MSVDVKGDAYEDLLERNAQDVKGGAGQYFTPRPLIDAIVDVIQLRPCEIVCDPACGTGGFLLSAYDYVADHYDLDREQKKHLRYDALRGVELVEGVGRLCAMNLYLHGIGPDDAAREVPIASGDDSLREEPSEHVGVVLTIRPLARSHRSRWSRTTAKPPSSRSPTVAPTSGPRPATSSLTSSSM